LLTGSTGVHVDGARHNPSGGGESAVPGKQRGWGDREDISPHRRRGMSRDSSANLLTKRAFDELALAV